MSNPFEPSSLPSDASSSRRPPQTWPPRRDWITVLVCLVVIALVRTSGAWLTLDGGQVLDNAIINIVTLIAAFVAIMTLVVWFCRFSAYSRQWRHAVAFGLLGAVAAAVVLLRIESTNGDLVPRLRPRWAKRADELLEKPKTAEAAAVGVDLAGETPDDFPQFLGPRRHPYLPDVRLASDWTKHPPREVWRQKIGAGLAAFAVVNGFAVTLEQRGEDELTTCYDARTGALKWAHSVRARHSTVLGGVGPRSTPTIHQGRVYALGATGVLRCLDGADGREVWKQDLMRIVGTDPDKDGKVVAWGRSSSPLVVDDLVIVPAGGPPGGTFVSLMAFDRETGKRVWSGGDTQISFASPTLATLAGVRQVLSVNESNVTGHDPADGRVLWTHAWPGASNASASTSQPVVLAGDRLLLSKGYGQGSAVVQVTRGESGDWSTSDVWKRPTVLKTKFTNVVVRDGHAYGLSDGILECAELSTGRSRWKRGRYEHGQILGVGEHLLVLSETGELVLLPASPERPEELGRIQALEGQTWNNLCLYGTLLLVRNGEWAACWELKTNN